jgi:hypothetical protein
MAEPHLVGLIVHRIPGRARVRFPELRGEGVRLDSLAAGLLAIPGVTHAAPHAMTGSIVVRHGAEWSAVASSAASSLGIAWDDDGSRAGAGDAADREANLRILLGAALGAFAFWQLARQNVLPPAITLLWYAVALVTGRSPGH